MRQFVAVLNEQDLKYHARVVGKIDSADQGVLAAHAQLSRASMAQESARLAMGTWLEEVAERYGLLTEDIVDREGHIRYVDPNWRTVLAQEAAAEPETVEKGTEAGVNEVEANSGDGPPAPPEDPAAPPPEDLLPPPPEDVKASEPAIPSPVIPKPRSHRAAVRPL